MRLGDHVEQVVTVLFADIRDYTARAGAFALPANSRGARFGTKIGLTEPFLAKVAEAVIAEYGDFYPELEKNKATILDNLTREEVRFARTVEAGTAHLQNHLDNIRSQNKTSLDGHIAFDLYATYGLPFEINLARVYRVL